MRLFMMTLAFLFSIAACVMVNVLPADGQGAFDLVSRFPVPIAPSAIVLLFWPIVYGAIAFWLAAHIQKRTSIPPLYAILFILATIAHALTFFSWQQQLFQASVLFALLAPILLFYMYTTFYNATSNRWRERIPLSLFISFLTCLLLWEGALTFTYFELYDFGLTDQLWGIFFLTAATAVAIAVRYYYNDPYFLIAYMWLFLCIILEHHIEDIFISSVALFLLLATAAAMYVAKRTP